MSSTQANAKKKIGLNTIISWGASVVIVGLMFKILHLAGGEIMIAVGLLTEAVLFFILGFASMSVETTSSDGSTTDKGGAALHDLLATAITPKMIESLSMGFKQFNNTVATVNQVAGSFNVTEKLVKEMESTTTDVKKFRDNMTAVSTGFDQFNKALQSIAAMSSASQGMVKDFEVAGQGMRSFTKNVTDMNNSFDQFSKTLASINQLTASSATMLKEFEAATNGMKAYNKNLTDLTKVYQAQLDAFKKN